MAGVPLWGLSCSLLPLFLSQMLVFAGFDFPLARGGSCGWVVVSVGGGFVSGSVGVATFAVAGKGGAVGGLLCRLWD